MKQLYFFRGEGSDDEPVDYPSASSVRVTALNSDDSTRGSVLGSHGRARVDTVVASWSTPCPRVADGIDKPPVADLAVVGRGWSAPSERGRPGAVLPPPVHR